MYLVRNGEICKIQKIYWCEEVLHLADISNKNLSEPDLTPRMKYIIVRLEKWDRSFVQEGWQNTGIVYGTRVMYDYTILSLGLDSISLECSKNMKKICS